MSEQELSAVVMLLGYAAVLVVAVKVFGIRRVLWAIALVVVLAVMVAFRTLGSITGGRR